MSIFIEHIDAAITDHDDALSFLLLGFDVLDLTEGRGRLGVGQRKRAWFHGAERLFEKLFHLGRVYVAEYGNDAVLRHDIAITKFKQLFLGQFLHRLGRTIGAKRVGMMIEKRLAQNIAGDRRGLFLFLFDPGDLDFLFARDDFLGHGRVEQNIGEQFDSEFQVGFGDIERNTETVVAGVA